MEEDGRRREGVVEKRRVGRPAKGEEKFKKERSASIGSVKAMEEYIKRRREREEEEKDGEERMEIFKRSRLTERSPTKSKEENKGMKEMLIKLTEAIQEMKDERRKEWKEWREQYKEIKEEINKGKGRDE